MAKDKAAETHVVTERKISMAFVEQMICLKDMLKEHIRQVIRLLIDKEKLDGKFYSLVFREKDNTSVNSLDVIHFMAYDNALPATLRFYLEECKRQGAGQPQLSAVDELIRRVDLRRAENAAANKIPDVHPNELSWYKT